MPRRTVYLETFGCQMNELDSQLVTGQLRALGYDFAHAPEAADIVLYNTCSVRDLAEQKVRSRLGEMNLRKQVDPRLVVGVLGCMAERDGEKMIQRFPAVDVLCGPGELDKLPVLLDNALRTRESLAVDQIAGERGSAESAETSPAPMNRVRSARQIALQGDTSRRSTTLAAAEDQLEMLDLSRTISASDHNGSAYVRITRGCNKFCTYCVVPRTRGAEIHRPPQHIIDECKKLADSGVIEVTLLGQTVNHYRFEHGAQVVVNGITQPQKGRSYKGGHRRDPFAGDSVTTFADLLARIHEEVPAIQRLRFVTSYPRDFGDDVLEVIRESPRICRYLHVPAQSGSNDMLAAMNRGYTVEQYLEFVDRACALLDQPEIGRPLMLAGDMIVGFCGETEADSELSRQFLRRVRYKNCFVFKYSPRPGTTAFDRMADDVPAEVKRRRCNELLAVQQEISDSIGREQVGTVQSVFVEGVSVHEAKKHRASASSHEGVVSGATRLTISASGTVLRNGEGADSADRAVDQASGFVHESERPLRGESGIQLTGRTDGDLIVVFECPQSMAPDQFIGTIRRVRIERASTLTMWGTVER